MMQRAFVVGVMTAMLSGASPGTSTASGRAEDHIAGLLASSIPDSILLTFDQLERLWTNGEFDQALEALLQYRRSAPYGKNELVDYMIGTSACRVPQKQAVGREFLEWMLQHYSLSPASREKVIGEIQACTDAVAGEAFVPVLIASPSLAQASPGVSGKMFYDITRGEDVPISNDPVRVVREVPAESLAARLFTAEEWVDAMGALERRIGGDFELAHSSSFVLASSSHRPRELEEIGLHLERLLSFYLDGYDMTRPEHLIAVYLVPTSWDMRQVSERIHGMQPSPQAIGYSLREDQSMVAVIPGQALGTLGHELFHLVVRRDFGDIPPWLDEGMAALYEVAVVEDDRVSGMPNWRGPVLRMFWDRRPSVEELVRMDWRGFENADEAYASQQQMANHAMARYFALYLQDHGGLRPVFKAFRDRPVLGGNDPQESAVQLLEEVLGRPLTEVDTDFTAWFEGLVH